MPQGYHRLSFYADAANSVRQSGISGVANFRMHQFTSWTGRRQFVDLVIPSSVTEQSEPVLNAHLVNVDTTLTFTSDLTPFIPVAPVVKISDCAGNLLYTFTGLAVPGLKSSATVTLTFPNSNGYIVDVSGPAALFYQLSYPKGTISSFGAPAHYTTCAFEETCAEANKTLGTDNSVMVPLANGLDVSTLLPGIFVSPFGNDAVNNGTALFPVKSWRRAQALAGNLPGLKSQDIYFLPGLHNVSQCDTLEVNTASSSCLLVNMTDAYGDGWGTISLTLSSLAGVVIKSLSLISGTNGVQTVCFPYWRGFQIVVGDSQYGTEISWKIQEKTTGKFLASGGAGVSKFVNVPPEDMAWFTVTPKLPMGLSSVKVYSCADVNRAYPLAIANPSRLAVIEYIPFQKILNGFDVVVHIDSAVQGHTMESSFTNALFWTMTYPFGLSIANGTSNSTFGCQQPSTNFSLSAFTLKVSQPPYTVPAVATIADCSGNILFFDNVTSPAPSTSAVQLPISALLGNGYIARVASQFPASSSMTWTLGMTNETSIYGSSIPINHGSDNEIVHTCPFTCSSTQLQLLLVDLDFQSFWNDSDVFLLTNCQNETIFNTSLASVGLAPIFACVNESSMSGGFSISAPQLSWSIYYADGTARKGMGSYSTCSGGSVVTCGNPRMGNGICDADLNVAPCWDSGDCCHDTCTSMSCVGRPKSCQTDHFKLIGLDSSDGQTAILSGKGSVTHRITKFPLTHGRVTLRNLHFENYAFTRSPFMTLLNDSVLSIEHCSFTNFSSPTANVLVVSGAVRLIDSMFDSFRSVSGSPFYTNESSVVLARDLMFSHSVGFSSGGVGSLSSSTVMINCTGVANHVTVGGLVTAIGTSNVLVIDSSVSNSLADEGGAAVFVDSATAQIQNTQFHNNSGAHFGDVVISNANSALIRNILFSGATAAEGAGLFCGRGAATLSNVVSIVSSNFSNNNGSLRGGGLMSDCVLFMLNCHFDENDAGMGGGVFSSSRLTVTDSTFSNNSATMAGGAMFLSGTSNTTLRANFSDNFSSGVGGAVAISGSLTAARSSLLARDSQFTHNTAGTHGGAFWISQSSFVGLRLNISGNIANEGGAIRMVAANSVLRQSAVENNQALTGGGALTVDGQLTIVGCDINGNTAVNGGAIELLNTTSSLISTNVTYSHNTASENGGAITVNSATLTLSNSTLSSNTAGNKGGSMYLEVATVNVDDSGMLYNRANAGGGIWAVLSVVSVEDSRFVGNVATQDGGALLTSSIASDSVFQNNMFIGNQAGMSGGGVLASSSQHSLEGCVFDSNSAGTGGAVSLSFSPLVSFTDNVMRNNFATLYGGGVYMINSLTPLSNSLLQNNSAALGGGIAAAQYLVSPALLSNVTMIGNSATGGGGVLATDSQMLISASRFVGNSAMQCGGVLATRVNLTVEGSSFEANHVINGGGAVCSTDFFALSVTNSQFSGNSAGYGGALYLDTSLVSTPALVSSSNFSLNHAATTGGAIDANTNLVLTNDMFSSNLASGDGGGAVHFTLSTLNLGSSSFSNNSATGGQGGGLLATSAVTHVVSSDFTTNKAVDGGAISTQFSPTTISSCVFSSNVADNSGGGVLLTKSESSNVVDSIFAANNATHGNGGALAIESSNSVAISASTFSNNSAPKGSGGALHIADSQDRLIDANNKFSDNVAGFGASLSSAAAALLLENDVVGSPTIRELFDGVVRVTLVDEFGQNMTTENKATATLIDSSNQAQPLQVALFENGVATFSAIALNSGCARTHNLLIIPSIANISAESFSVYLECRSDSIDVWGFVVAVGLFLFLDLLVVYIVFVNRKNPVIARSSPMFCFLQLTGDLLILVGLIPFVVSHSAVSCSFAIALWAFGFTLAYGSLFLKTWRIMKLFGNHSLSRLVLPNEFLLGWLTVLLIIDLILLIAIFATNTPDGRVTNLPFDEKRYEVCYIPSNSIPMLVLLILKVIFLLYGVVLSFRVSRLFRQNFSSDKKDFNESKHIQYCLNNTLLFLIVIVPVVFVLNESQWKLQISLIAVAIISTSQFNALILFPPKILKLYRNSVSVLHESRQDASHAKRLATLFFPKVVFPTNSQAATSPDPNTLGIRKPNHPSVSVTTFGPIVETPSENQKL